MYVGEAGAKPSIAAFDRTVADRSAPTLHGRLAALFAEDPALHDRFQRSRRLFGSIRPSQYDVSNICNLRCEGCLFYAGDDWLGHAEEADADTIDAFFRAEAARGVNFAQFGGAEPALRLDMLRAAARHIKQGMVFTNGTVRIPEDIPYRLHISVWGLGEEGADVVEKAVRLFAKDPRAVFAFVVNARNLESIPDVVRLIEKAGTKLTFSHFSPTLAYETWLKSEEGQRPFFQFSADEGALALDAAALARSRELIGRAMRDAPDTAVYNDVMNRLALDPAGLYRIDPDTALALDCGSRVTRSYRHFHTDLSDAGDVKCCTPNIACRSCRLYPQSISSVLAWLDRYSDSREALTEWLDVRDLWGELFLPVPAAIEIARNRRVLASA